MERVRKQADECHNLQGFFLFHALGGGTGSGIGAEVLNALRDDYGGKQPAIATSIFPSPQHGAAVLEPYNSVLFSANSLESADLSLCLDNENARRMCATNLGFKHPEFPQVNAIFSQVISLATTSLRYPMQVNAALSEIVTNLVPAAPFRFALLSLAPVCAPSSERAKKGFTIGGEGDLLSDLFKPANVMCDVGHTLKMNRFLSATLLVRGKVGHAAGRDVTKDDVQKGCGALLKRGKVKFLPWQGDQGSWKMGICDRLPTVPGILKSKMAASPMQAAMLGNCGNGRDDVGRRQIHSLFLLQLSLCL